MKDLHEILAKSKNYGNLTLLEHTEHVTQAIEKFATEFAFDFNVDIARKGSILHDLGKAHPYFQRRMQEYNGVSLAESNEWDFAHRHEISSLAFLPLFPKDEWNTLIDLVIAHHKSIENDPSERGILDLKTNDRAWKEHHLKDWENWCEYGLQIVQKFGIAIRSISIEEATEALEYVESYCENKKYTWSPLRGLLKSADHFASAFMGKTKWKLKPLFKIPNLSHYHKPERQSSIYPLSQVSTDNPKKHTLVVAPTGAGKTDFLLRRCRKRVFYTLPFQASINAMYLRIQRDISPDNPDLDIRLLHATSKIVVKNRIDEQILQPLVGSSVKILTPHQLAAIVFGTSGFESVMLDIQETDIILDEIHTYSDYSQAMVLEIVKALLRLDCRIHIGTATMPTVLYKELLALLGGEESVYEVKLSDEILSTFNRHQIYKVADENEINSILETAFARNEKVLVIYNTIGEAQDAFQKFQEDFPHIEKMLIHSRFKRGDRVALEKRLTEEFNEKISPCLVVSTQVVEVSLDISFDRMITQAAPLDSLIQRFGRVNRKRNETTIGKYKPIHVITPGTSVLPYKMNIVKASFEQLPDNGELLEEHTLQAKIDSVYPVLDTKQIDVHLIFKANKYTIKELTNFRKAVLVEALEIESATCILESDRTKYETADWEERLYMEIPVNYKSVSRHKSKFEQLQIGMYPFVIPQREDQYQLLGLQLIEHDNFF
ncbi:CRISPR-associated helicase Cas3' [Cytophagaceae bacterium DM2B3-1]|uniref:CRISPR-associated helicase Cas3 n=1 Tax=Xanthocytophaga flava TaxID=3048013 RepID=A0ABT7CT60_9BACT|nr:CRISPR-associated helicase Cas3' [Xanthocytophaga flavus]MDJ1496934.1 CRISPR-associated helicase Cas3' [Xanthocytophaga flavus]